MMKFVFSKSLTCLILLQLVFTTCSWANPLNEIWVFQNGGEKKIKLHFFWSKTCPHCLKAKPFIKNLATSYDWIALESYEITENKKNAEFYVKLSEKVGNSNFGVPAFAFCGQIRVGFFDEDTTGAKLRNQLLKCRDELLGRVPETGIVPDKESKLSIPFYGDFNPTHLSLPIFTIVIAGLDAFNPCAFFVLLLLLSLLVNTRSRKRMLLIGGIFVFFSGIIYFIFMAAWLNVFLYIGELRIITVVAALIAIGVSLFNIKDYFYFKEGVSLSIPEGAKPNLYKRIRNLTNTSRLSMMIFGTVILAITANAYELLCTSGFPMVFTRVLTLNNLSMGNYYLYLVLYNLIYIVPLSIIVLVFVFTMGSRKLTEREGRILKLVSGIMMLFLGLVLLIKPTLLNNFLAALGMLLSAIALSIFIRILERIKQRSS